MDLVEFVTARLVEDEMHAQKDIWCADRASAGGQWDALYGYNLAYSELRAGGEVIGRLTAMPPWPGGRPDCAEDQHQKDLMLVGRMTRAARPRAERMLREVAAKRAILAEVVPAIEAMDMQIIGEWGTSQDEPDAHLPLLKIMAAVYSDHPDYDQEWAP